MTEPTFVIGAAIACGSVVAIVRTIAAATVGRRSSIEVERLRDQCEQYAVILEETQSTLAHQAAQLAELQERVDFAERLLAQPKPPAAPGGNV